MFQCLSFLYDLLNLFRNHNRKCLSNILIFFFAIAENREECSFIWDNYYYEDEKINEYDLSLFIETDKDSGLYRKYEETHYQRAYTLEEMKELIRKSGLEFVTAYDAFSKNAPMDTSERIYVIAREQGK